MVHVGSEITPRPCAVAGRRAVIWPNSTLNTVWEQTVWALQVSGLSEQRPRFMSAETAAGALDS